jgi:hypothetical protein
MDDAFGAPTGKLTDPTAGKFKNEFSTIPSQNVDDMLRSDRIQPRQMGTGVMRGTQRISNTDGSYITLGVIPNSSPEEFGIAHFDADDTLIKKSTAEADYQYNSAGVLVSKSTGVTDFKYDATTGKNYYQNGQLPDGSYGAIFMKPNYNVSDAVS